MADLPGYDFAIQALSGLMSVTGPVDGPPCKVGVAVSDVLTGLYAAVSVLACLHARKQSGHGYAIDLALLGLAVAAQVNLVQAYLTSGAVPPARATAAFPDRAVSGLRHCRRLAGVGRWQRRPMATLLPGSRTVRFGR